MKSIKELEELEELEELLKACELSIEVDPENALVTKNVIRNLLKETPLNAWENLCKILANGRSELSVELSREIIAQKIFSKNRTRTRIDTFDELERTEANPRGAVRPKSNGLATEMLTAYNKEKKLKRLRGEDAPEAAESNAENPTKKPSIDADQKLANLRRLRYDCIH